MLISLMALALAAHDGPDGVIATAPATPALPLAASAPDLPADAPATTIQSSTPHNLTTDEQIARWIDRRDPAQPAFAEDEDPVDDRKMHGEVSAGIGTGGYRDVGVWMSVPFGENGRVDLSYRETKNGWGTWHREPTVFDGWRQASEERLGLNPSRDRDGAREERGRRRPSVLSPSALD